MPRRFAAFFLLSLPLLSGRAHAQAPGSATTMATAPTVTASTQLVVVDVSVLGPGGIPVSGLKREDFQVTESGVPQQITSFEAHAPSDTARAKPLPPLPPGVFTNYAPVSDGAPVNVLLIDTLNTPITAQPYLHAQVLKYLETATPGTRLAVFVLSQHLRMLQGFTTDTELLKAALRDGRGTRQAMSLEDPSVQMSRAISDEYASDPTQAQAVAQIQEFSKREQRYETAVRIQYSLDGLELLARYLSGIPGRKNLLWFSGAFPITLLPDKPLAALTGGTAFEAEDSFVGDFKRISSAMQNARVAIYPVDARGVQTNPALAAESRGIAAQAAHNLQMLAKPIDDFERSQTDEHSTMSQMADQTGGRAFFGTNDLKQSIDLAVADGATFYTLTYRPEDRAAQHPGFHPIEVRLSKPGYHLSYRRGYDVSEGSSRHRLSMSPSLQHTRDELTAVTPPGVRLAMAHGAPSPTEIIIESGVAPIAEPPEEKVHATNSASPRIKGPFRTYSVNTICRASALALNPEPDGRGALHVAVTSLLYTPDGVVANSTSKVISGHITQATQQAELLRVHQELSVPLSGEYSVRVILRDLNNNHVGALELPVSTINKLKPITRNASTAPEAGAPGPPPASAEQN